MTSLLPGSSGLFEKALEASLNGRWSTFQDGTAGIRTAKLVQPPPSALPYLVYEYGLGSLTPYVPNLYNLIDEGVAWERLRGTPAALAMGLGWIGYIASLEEEETSRAWWNSYQLRFPALPAADDPDLDRIEGIAGLSTPERSQLRRGVFQYDVGPAVADATRLDQSLLETESGARLHSDGPLWSFGRTHELDHVLSEAEGTALGIWIDPAGDGLAWDEAAVAWENANFAWEADGIAVRKQIMALSFLGRTAHVALKNDQGAVLGYRRALCIRACVQQAGGPYVFAGLGYMPSPIPDVVLIEARTAFGDAAGSAVATVSIILDGVVAEGVPAGRPWLAPDELAGGTEIASAALAFTARPTVREHIKFRLRF